MRAATRAYLTRELSALGYAPREEPFAWTETMSATDLDSGEKQSSSRRHKDRHVLAEKRGLLEPERILEVAAHFDTVPRSPGADDNASGVAALLEVAAALAPLELARTVRFCFFSQEERFLIGSRRHVEAFTARGEQVEGALVLDGVGYTDHRPDSQSSPVWIPLVAWPPSTGDFLLIVGDHRSGGLGDLFEGATARYAPELELYGVKRLGGLFKDAARSDHANYWRAGLPAVLLTDSGNFRNPNYHRPSDTPETLDFEFLTRVTRATAATAASWAGLMRPRN